MSATLTHMVLRVSDLGYTVLQAAPILSFGAAAGFLGRSLWLSGGSGRPPSGPLFGDRTQFLGRLGMLQTTDYALFALFATLFGFGMGGIVPLHGAIAGQVFGRENFGKVMGLMRPAMMPLQITGLPFAGWVFDRFGAYDLAFQVFLVLYGVSALCASALRIEKSTA